MIYYLDTEFDGYRGPLISLALVSECGKRSLYAVCYDAAQNCKDEWVKANVVPILESCPRVAIPVAASEFGKAVELFLEGDREIEIRCDWPDDFRYLCESLITGPGEMVNVQSFSLRLFRVDAYPTAVRGAIQHNAWWDAVALREKLAQQPWSVARYEN